MKILGVDGGGSKTTFLMVDPDLELFRLETGPSNYISVGRVASRLAIAQGIGSLPSKPDVVCGGFAGAGREEGRTYYLETLRSLLPEARILIETDAFIAYIGAAGIRPGIILIAGTGSIVVGRRDDGTTFRSGGWGPQFGDDGGGFWIGREAIRVSLSSVDFGANVRFRNYIAKALGLESIDEAVTRWADGSLTVPDVAALFPAIAEDYPNEPAKTILDEAAKHLRVLTQRSVAALGANAPYTTAAGSLALHPLMQELISLPFEPPIDTPEKGAILWAMENVEGSP
jgi:N-acetylglucosamine kinase-like BadF-type ATPase